MEEEKILNTQESFAIIQRMIRSVKEDLEDKSFYYILWGWAVFIACVSQYTLMKINYKYNFIGWIILMPVAGMITSIYSARQGKKKRVKTYVDELMGYVLTAFMASLFIVLFCMTRLQLSTYPMVMMVYGAWLFISGGALKFRPFMTGGIINWILCVVALFLSFEYQLMALAAAVMLGYIIPGYMLRSSRTKIAATAGIL